MADGYFVGRKELAEWIRDNFDPGFSKVEDLASGVVYCKIMDSIYPGSVSMSKVKKDAKIEVDFIHNFRILQNAFTKKKIDRYIEVDRLTKRSFQSNMEFLQFIKCYWDMHAPAGAGVPSAPPALKDSDGTNRVPSQPVQKKAPPPSAAWPASRAQSARGPTAQKLELEVTELKCNIDNLECERDFYYSKLREIEVLCQEHEAEEVPFLQQVMSILLKTDADDEFVAPAQ